MNKAVVTSHKPVLRQGSDILSYFLVLKTETSVCQDVGVSRGDH